MQEYFISYETYLNGKMKGFTSTKITEDPIQWITDCENDWSNLASNYQIKVLVLTKL